MLHRDKKILVQKNTQILKKEQFLAFEALPSPKNELEGDQSHVCSHEWAGESLSHTEKLQMEKWGCRCLQEAPGAAGGTPGNRGCCQGPSGQRGRASAPGVPRVLERWGHQFRLVTKVFGPEKALQSPSG